MTIWLKTRLFSEKSILFVMVFILLATLPASDTNASLFSFLFNKETVAPKSFTETSQNLALLKAVSNFNPNPAKGGGDITIVEGTALLPDSGPLGTIADIPDETAKTDHISIYVVREGDSLSQIGKMFGVSVNTIIWANDLNKSGLIHEGQELVILPISGVQHTVAKGDTIQSIATKYKGHLEEIMEFNGLTEKSVLAVGDVVVIPDGEVATPVYSTSGTTAKVKGSGGPEYEGYYLRPLSAGTKTQGLHGYNGIDIGAPVGTPVFASASGQVIISRSSGWNGGYGQYIVIRHDNGTQTLYSHLSSNIVSAGWSVVKGQVIGYVGSTGKSTGPHLHFEVRGAKNPF